ncbi:MAG: hypothetical protein JW783_01390 [Bacteroidales bacterium]|nr:hypothetical protein [Bacteroidales bacterium]
MYKMQYLQVSFAVNVPSSEKKASMGYSAYVICNCYKEGKTAEPPHKEFMRLDEDGLYLDIPNELWEKDENRVYQMEADFDKWKQTACEHKEMELANEFLSNITGMAAFRHIISELGGSNKFPVLTKYLPIINGGALPSEFAQQALDELLLLEKEQTMEEKVVLIEKSTGSLIASVNSDTYWLFIFTKNSKNTYGIDKDGFFILENGNEKGKDVSYVMFRSNNFIQQTISQDCFKFIDIPSGQNFECSAKLFPNQDETTNDYEFEVQTKRVEIDCEYEYMIEPLKHLARVSILSGNPIHWT